MLKNLKISLKLWIWIGVITLFLVFMGIANYTRVNKLHDTFEKISKEVDEIYLVMSLSLAINESVMPANDYLVAGGDKNEIANFELLDKEVEKKFKIVESTMEIQSDEEELFILAKKDYGLMKEKVNKIFALTREQSIGNESQGKLMEEVDTLSDNAVTSINKWQNIAKEESLETTKEFLDIQQEIIFINTIIILFIISFSFIIGVFIINSITKSINNLTKTAKSIIEGDLTNRVKITSKDEIAQLGHDFNQMADSLVDAKQFPENIIRSMKNGLIVVTPDLKISKTNQEMANLTGLTADEILGSDVIKFLSGSNLKNIFKEKSWNQTTEDIFDKYADSEIINNEGKKIPVRISGSIMKNKQNQITAIVIIFQDMQVYQQLEKQKEIAIKIEKEKEKEERLLLEKSAKDMEIKIKERTADLEEAMKKIQNSEAQSKQANAQLKEMNEQLAKSQQELQEKISELERFNNIVTDREIKMIELKQEIAELKKLHSAS